MALILSVRPEESVYVGDRRITLLKILTPVKYRVLVEGPLDTIYEITAKERTEILPDVYLSAGIDANMTQAKLAFDAPRDRVILRQRLYDQQRGGHSGGLTMITFDVSSTAVLNAMRMGLGEDPEQLVSLLSQFARLSARVTHPQGNRRYGGYVLDVKGPRVYDVAKYDASPVCPDCHGTGKHHMRDQGRWLDVPCQNPQCTEKPRAVAFG